jgi:hypothetical protein
MDNVFRELTISWRGEEYKFVPSMQLMRSIEETVSFPDIASRTAEGKPPFSHISFVVWKMLKAAGAKVTEGDVYFEISSGKQETVTEFVSLVLNAFSPVDTDSKNPAAQTGSQSKARATKSSES